MQRERKTRLCPKVHLTVHHQQTCDLFPHRPHLQGSSIHNDDPFSSPVPSVNEKENMSVASSSSIYLILTRSRSQSK
jgi:hypothetical protein